MSVEFRQFSWDDLDTLVVLCNASLVADGEAAYIDADYLKMRYSVSAAFPEICIVAWDGDTPVGASMALYSTRDGKGLASLYIHPDWRNNDLTEQLIEFSDQRFIEFTTDRTPEPKPIYLLRGVESHLMSRMISVQNLGYEEVRHFYNMIMTLPDVPAPLNVPEPYHITSFNPDNDAEAIHACYDAAFRDAWGQRDGVPFESWQRSFMKDDTDYSLWSAIWHEGRIIAFAISYKDPATPNTGRVRSLGVLPAYRKQGLGSALLRHAFKRFHKKGWAHASLNVDGDGDTNPIRIYRKAGMRVDTHTIMFRRVLRGDSALIND